MKYPSQLRHIDTSLYSAKVDYIAETKDKREVNYKLALLDELGDIDEYHLTKNLVESKIESFFHELSLQTIEMVSSYHIENIIGNSILMRFSKRPDIRLNLYLEDVSDEFVNNEEACLSYLQDSKRTILIGSIDQVTPKLISLLL